jgi:hypothetical protein
MKTQKFFVYDRPVVTPVIYVDPVEFDRLKALQLEFKQKAFVSNKLDLLMLLHKLSVRNHVRGADHLDLCRGYTYLINSIETKTKVKLNTRNLINKLSKTPPAIPEVIYLRLSNTSNGFRWTFRIAERSGD